MTEQLSKHFLVSPSESAGDDRPELARIIGADFSAMSITPQRADLAPSVTRSALQRFSPFDSGAGIDLCDWKVVDHGDAGAVRENWDGAFAAISTKVAKQWGATPLLVVLGGDHSISWPVVAGIVEARSNMNTADTGDARADAPGTPNADASQQAAPQRLGIVHIDIHTDTRPLDNGPSNGTPFRGIVEGGLVQGADIVQIGIHPLANRTPNISFCDERKITRVPLARVVAQGGGAVARQALSSLSDCDAIHLSVDIDVLDRSFAPGTVAALPGGLWPAHLADIIDAVCADKRVRSMDVVEFDPERDVAGTTALNVAQAVMFALAATAARGTARGTH